MTNEQRSKITFHPDAVVRLSELAQEIVNGVRSFGPAEPPQTTPNELHPVVEIPASDIIGEVRSEQSAVNRLGEEVGRYWISKGLRVGWEAEGFDQVKQLARRFATLSPIKGLVSERFLLDEVFSWLRGTLERQQSDCLSDYIAERCSDAIEEHEIWIPVHRTYSAEDFALGTVEFRTVSKAMMDDWFGRRFPQGIKDPGVAHVINRERSQIQAGIAARLRVKAEREKAREIAHALANEAVGLLRFLSHVNWTCRLVSYCTPLGSEGQLQAVELFVRDGSIISSSKEVIDQGPSGWSLDEARAISPGLFESIQRLASDPEATEFRRDLYDALQLHSRNSVATAISHKIVFVIAAIESLLLKDSNEPIQKNLGERIAFIIGKSLEERKKIVANVEEFYRIRSNLIHHGREATPKNIDVIDRFFVNVWWTLRHLLGEVDRYKTRGQLLTELEDKKLS
jgi:hypothetical protein